MGKAYTYLRMSGLKEMQERLYHYSTQVRTIDVLIAELRILISRETNTRIIQRLKQQLLDEEKRREVYLSALEDWTERIYEEKWGPAEESM